MIPKWKYNGSYYRVFFLSICMAMAPKGLHAQSQTIGQEFQGTIFTPATEDSSHSRGSVLQSTMILETSYNTNLLQSQLGPEVQGSYQVVEGAFTYDIRRPGDDLLLRYWGGQRLYPAYSNLSAGMQDVRLQWQHRVNSRLHLVTTSRYASLPGGIVLESNPEQGFPLLGSNANAYSFLQQKFTTVEATLSATENLSPHLVAVFGTNFVDTAHVGINLINTKELDGYGGFYYVPTSHQTIGVVYAQQWMKFGLGFGSSEVKSLFLSYILQLTPTVSVSAFGGPSQIAQTTSNIQSASGTAPGVPVALQSLAQSTESGILGGVKIERRHRHNIARLSYSQLITSGGGYLSSVLQRRVELNVSRSLSPRVDLNLAGTYSMNSQIGLSSLYFKTFYVEPSLNYRMNRNLKLTLRSSYGKVEGLLGSAPIKRGEVTLRLEYTLPQISLRK
jgi:hypothetical protein